MILEIEFEPYCDAAGTPDEEELIESASILRVKVMSSMATEGGVIYWHLSCLPDIVFCLQTKFDLAGNHAHIWFNPDKRAYYLFVDLVCPDGDSLGFEIPLKRVTEVKSLHPLPEVNN